MPIHVPGLHGAFLRSDAVQSFGRHDVDAALARGEILSPWRGVLVDPPRGADPIDDHFPRPGSSRVRSRS